MLQKFTSALFCALCVCLLTVGEAQAQATNPYLHLGLGIGSSLGQNGAKGIPPVGASLDYPITEAITVGGYVGYTGYTVPVFGNIEAKTTYLILGARGTYHVDLGPEKLDPYGGLMLGYNIVNSKLTGDTAFPYSGAASGVGYSFFVGANYNFTEKFGAFAELGYGIAILQVGLNVNL